MYTYFSNQMETGMLGLFILMSRRRLDLGINLIEDMRPVYYTMWALIPSIAIMTPWIVIPWEKYLSLVKIILDALEEITTEEAHVPYTCQDYWNEWDQEG